MLNVQKMFYEYLSIGGMQAFRDALANIGVDVRDYPEHQFMLLDYNQIEATDNHPVSDECRGLIISYEGKILRKGFNRFYNMGQAGHDNVDFENSYVYEKSDGSLMFVWYCTATGRWELGTRGTAFAEGPANFHPTFRDFFLNCIGKSENKFQKDCNECLNKEYTYLWEAVGPDNRIVVPYKENHLVFHCAVENETGKEYLYFKNSTSPLMLHVCGWKDRYPKIYKITTKEECMKILGELSGLEEGFVVFNPNTQYRVKIKSPVYLAAHRLRGNGLTINSICELVAMHEFDEYLAVFPEDSPKFNRAIEVFDKMKAELFNNYNRYKDIENQKDFALAVKNFPLSSVMFKARKAGTDVIHEFNQFSITKRAEWLKDELQK